MRFDLLLTSYPPVIFHLHFPASQISSWEAELSWIPRILLPLPSQVPTKGPVTPNPGEGLVVSLSRATASQTANRETHPEQAGCLHDLGKAAFAFALKLGREW